MTKFHYQWYLKRVGPYGHIRSVLKLSSQLVTISRSLNATHFFSSLFLSRKHSSLKFDGNQWIIIDHGGINGTYVNLEKLKPEQEYILSHGDIIGFGMPISERMKKESIVYELCRELTEDDAQILKPELLQIKSECLSCDTTAERLSAGKLNDKINTRTISHYGDNLCNVSNSVTDVTLCNSSENVTLKQGKRKIKITPRRELISLTSSEDENIDGLLQNAITNLTKVDYLIENAATDVKKSAPGFDNDELSLNRNAEGDSSRLKEQNDTKYINDPKLDNTSKCVPTVSVLSNTLGSAAESQQVHQQNEELDMEQSSERDNEECYEIDPFVNNSDLQADVGTNFQDAGYSQNDEVIIISDDETYFSQNIVKIEDLKLKPEVCEEVVVEDEFDEWATILKQTDNSKDLHLDSISDDCLKEIHSVECQPQPKADELRKSEDSSNKEYDVNDFFPVLSQSLEDSGDDVEEANVELVENKSTRQLDCEKSKTLPPLEDPSTFSDFFPVLSQSFEDSGDDVEEANVEFIENKSTKELDCEESKALPPVKEPFSFYAQHTNYNYDRLKNRTGNFIYAASSTRPTNALPVTIKKKIDVGKSTSDIIKSVKRKMINDSISRRILPLHSVEKDKSKNSLRKKVQHRMGHRIPIPGGGSAVPVGHKHLANIPSRTDRTTILVNQQHQEEPLLCTKSDSSPSANKPSEQNGVIPPLPETENGDINPHESTVTNEKPKRTKVLQRGFPSRNDLFAEALSKATSARCIKRKAPFEKSHPTPPKKQLCLQNTRGSCGNDIAEHDRFNQRQIILLNSPPLCQRPNGRNICSTEINLKTQQTDMRTFSREKTCSKHVTFSDDVKITYIEPIPVMDPSGVLETGMNMDSRLADIEAGVKRSLQRILSWRSVWLQEQAVAKGLPPVIHGLCLKSTSKIYTSHAEYIQAYEPLLLLETWESISHDRTHGKQSGSYNLVVNRMVDSSTNTTSHSLRFHCQVVISEDQEKLGLCPKEGWLGILTIPVKDKSQSSVTVSGTGASYTRVFAYVENCQRTSYSLIQKDAPVSVLLRQVAKRYKDKQLLLKLILKTKWIPVELCKEKFVNLELVSYIRPNLRLLDAVYRLPCTLMGSHLLQPRTELCTLSNSPPTQRLVHVGELFYNTIQRQTILKLSEAVISNDSTPKVYLVQGPPGTGKTSLIVGLIIQILFGSNATERQPQILLCAPSNGAIDENMSRLLELRSLLREMGGLRAVRIGQLESIQDIVKPFCLDNIVRKNIERRRRDDEKVLSNTIISLETRYNLKQQEFDTLQLRGKYAEANKVEQELMKLATLKEDAVRQLENSSRNITPEQYQMKYNRCRNDVLLHANVIATTLGSCTQHGMEIFLNNKDHPLVCIIDEATQSIEADTLLPLLFCVHKMILVGDPQQLPPTVLSVQAKEKRLNHSLFERLYENVKNKSPCPVIMLEEQYRMHAELCAFPSRAFYNSKLRTNSGLQTKYQGVPFSPYIIFDVSNSVEESTGIGDLCNTNEAVVVIKLCEALLMSPQHNFGIGVITFYQRQKRLLLEMLQRSTVLNDGTNHRIEINTVDGFQGREKDIIIMSAVRANSPNGSIGFIKSHRRLNVAITRARCALYICGHINSLMVNEHWRELILDAQVRNKVEKISSQINVSFLKNLILKKVFVR